MKISDRLRQAVLNAVQLDKEVQQKHKAHVEADEEFRKAQTASRQAQITVKQAAVAMGIKEDCVLVLDGVSYLLLPNTDEVVVGGGRSYIVRELKLLMEEQK